MTHDPLCPSVVKFYLATNDCVFCELIKKVRATYKPCVCSWNDLPSAEEK